MEGATTLGDGAFTVDEIIRKDPVKKLMWVSGKYNGQPALIKLERPDIRPADFAKVISLETSLKQVSECSLLFPEHFVRRPVCGRDGMLAGALAPSLMRQADTPVQSQAEKHPRALAEECYTRCNTHAFTLTHARRRLFAPTVLMLSRTLSLLTTSRHSTTTGT